ncbi:hypothetical protein CHS0354_034301 [Potamilus streckersoni]|uniref:Uncharacterized protein n=1 Tax=Potamilus streckersoni TaxID=2493646 RepID=A0AAE0TB39_9BIVA|nr:hypothetical protein CHS0354_034301 [Potamilus streckersoni]
MYICTHACNNAVHIKFLKSFTCYTCTGSSKRQLDRKTCRLVIKLHCLIQLDLCLIDSVCQSVCFIYSVYQSASLVNSVYQSASLLYSVYQLASLLYSVYQSASLLYSVYQSACLVNSVW